MNRRRALAFGLVVVFVALAGCSSVLGPDQPSQEVLTQNASYDWTSSANASINITGDTYKAVYRVDNQSTFVVWSRDSLGRERPLFFSALKFRYPDGRVVTANSSALTVTNQQKQTVIRLPAKNGKVAFEAPVQGKRFSTQTFVEGSYEVTIPKGMRVSLQPFARVSPAGYRTDRTASGRVRIHWKDIQSSAIHIRYYLTRDLYIFAGIAVVAILIALVGALYFLRQIKELERRRRDASPNEDGSNRR